MINGEPNEFLDHINHDDAAIKFRGETYFFDPKYWPQRSGFQYDLEIWIFPEDEAEKVIEFTKITGDSHIDCVNKFINAKLWEGKSFWEVEKEMEWTDIP